MIIVAYFAGLATLPGLVALGALLDGVRKGAWTVPSAVCGHHGPPGGGEMHWRVAWRCDVIMRLDDERRCDALWVRSYVARALPRRLLWPHEPATTR